MSLWLKSERKQHDQGARSSYIRCDMAMQGNAGHAGCSRATPSMDFLDTLSKYSTFLISLTFQVSFLDVWARARLRRPRASGMPDAYNMPALRALDNVEFDHLARGK